MQGKQPERVSVAPKSVRQKRRFREKGRDFMSEVVLGELYTTDALLYATAM